MQNQCENNDDCIVLNWPTDSYKCNRFANKNLDLTEYREIISKYNLTCGFPLYECKAPPSILECTNGICHEKTLTANLTKEQAFAILAKKENLHSFLEKFNSRYNEKEQSWTFIENKNEFGLPVYIVYATGKTRILMGR